MDAKVSTKTKTMTKAQSFYENIVTTKLHGKLLSDLYIGVHFTKKFGSKVTFFWKDYFSENIVYY